MSNIAQIRAGFSLGATTTALVPCFMFCGLFTAFRLHVVRFVDSSFCCKYWLGHCLYSLLYDGLSRYVGEMNVIISFSLHGLLDFAGCELEPLSATFLL